jgi:hypothetical protein
MRERRSLSFFSHLFVPSLLNFMFELIERFDFERIEKMMHAVNWKWAMHDGLRHPTINEMRDKCISLLISAKNDFDVVSSGGFKASHKINDEGHEIFKLEFVAAEHYIRN